MAIEQAAMHGQPGLTGLSVALTRLIMADGVSKLFLDAQEHVQAGLGLENLLWSDRKAIGPKGESISSMLTEIDEPLVVHTQSAAVLSAPWYRKRMIGAVSQLGEGRAWGKWKQDRKNHHVVAWAPWPLIWVDNVNHSTAAGLMLAGGRLKSSEHHDCTALLHAVQTDGHHWIWCSTGNKFSRVNNLYMAAIFVIGQRLVGAEPGAIQVVTHTPRDQ